MQICIDVVLLDFHRSFNNALESVQDFDFDVVDSLLDPSNKCV